KKEIDNNGCIIKTTDKVDCNLMRIHADFSIPYFGNISLGEEGTTTTGTYQFGIQYSDIEGFGYTGVYNITNPIPITDNKITQNFNTETNKSISLDIKGLDGEKYEHFNLIVIKTINNISTPELVGTY